MNAMWTVILAAAWAGIVYGVYRAVWGRRSRSTRNDTTDISE